MAEAGIDITTAHPKILTTEAVQDSDVVITMGCGDACPFFPGKRYEDWELDDPAGAGHRGRPPHPRRDQAPDRGPHQLTLTSRSVHAGAAGGRLVASSVC